ncbi:MAG: hypothetical protein EHM34_03890 [Nitrosopumilales archaeon]|nr:MAG: hypothetical protein EHM34_03890 [Nitrosopumilales archaeon]
MMTVEQIQEMVDRKDTLSPEEKHVLVKAMLANPKAKEILLSGALAQDNLELFIEIMLADENTI